MNRVWQVANIVSLGFALVANGLVGAQLLRLPAIADISDAFATPLTPAGYAFSIWSLIYALLVVFAVYQARQENGDLARKAGPYFVVASVCNGLWPYVFVQEWLPASVVLLLVLTAALYALLWRLEIALKNVSKGATVCVWWPLLVYTGWVTVASVVNVASLLDWMGVEVAAATATEVLIGVTVALLVLLVRRHVRELVLASAWGIVAIGVQQLQADAGSAMVTATAFLTGALLCMAALYHAYRNRRTNVFLHSAS